MFLAASRLLRPLNYLKISGYSLGKFHWGYPALFTAITLIYIILYPDNISLLTGNDSFLSGLLSCLNLLPGFYITALAAVATFNRKAMDEEIDGVTATLKAQENGQVKIRSLTRRRFLCYLFGYLSFISLFLLIAGIGGESYRFLEQPAQNEDKMVVVEINPGDSFDKVAMIM